MQPEFRQAKWRTPVLFERPKTETGDHYAATASGSTHVPASLARTQLDLPSLAQVDVIRHYTRLSQKNIGVDTSFYPLGSCTMKLNPKVNDLVATMPGSADVHPLVGDDLSQGSLEVIFDLQEWRFAHR